MAGSIISRASERSINLRKHFRMSPIMWVGLVVSECFSVWCVCFISLQVEGQRYYNWRDRIDRIMEEIDSISMKSQKICYSNIIFRMWIRSGNRAYTWRTARCWYRNQIFINGNEFRKSITWIAGSYMHGKYEDGLHNIDDDQIKEGEISYFISNSPFNMLAWAGKQAPDELIVNPTR